jgi:hypothetical protein
MKLRLFALFMIPLPSAGDYPYTISRTYVAGRTGGLKKQAKFNKIYLS